MSKLTKRIRRRGQTIGFLPTMGALHPGHLSLIQQARKDNHKVVVSIFVNPTQFGPEEDFTKYPRPFEKDVRLCREAGVDIIFYPSAKEMYANDYRTYVSVNNLSDGLCAKFRPGHFKGVATIVAKLFNIVQPDIAYFGQKDAQQAIIIQKMVDDLDMPVKIKVMPTVREKDGLALSSRNIYLSAKERKDALVLWQSLNLAKTLIRKSLKDTRAIIREMKQMIQQKKCAKIDYIAIVDPNTLARLKRISQHCLIAVAVWIGKTRLIDNLMVKSK